MQTRLISISNFYRVILPRSIIKQLGLDKGNLEIVVREEGILITPATDTPPLREWDKLFKEAKKNGFDAVKDAEEFENWDTTLSDGMNKI